MSSSVGSLPTLYPERILSYKVYAGIFVAVNVIGMFLMVIRSHTDMIRNRGWILVFFAHMISIVENTILLWALWTAADGSMFDCRVLIWPSLLTIPLWGFSIFIRCYGILFQYLAAINKLKYHDLGQNSWFLGMRWTNSLWFNMGFYWGNTLFWIVISLAVIYSKAPTIYTVNTTECGELFSPILYAQAAQLLVMFSLIIGPVIVWNVRDAFLIRYELMMDIVLTGSCFLVFVFSFSLPSFPGSPTFEPTWMILIIFFGTTWINLWMPVLASFPAVVSFCRRSYGLVFSHPPLTDANAIPPNFLYLFTLGNAIMFDSLKQYAIQSWCLENLLFVQSIMEYKKQYASRSAADNDFAMRKLVAEFIRTGAYLEINISDDSRKRVLAAEVVAVDVFDPAFAEVDQQLRNDTFIKWRQTTSFEHAWNSCDPFAKQQIASQLAKEEVSVTSFLTLASTHEIVRDSEKVNTFTLRNLLNYQANLNNSFDAALTQP